MPPPSDQSASTNGPGLAQPVRLSVPAAPRFLSAARVVAASLGAESGLSVDDLDDLRLGVNELVSLLVEVASSGGRIDLEFELGDGAVIVRGALDGATGPVELDDMTRRIIATVTDHHELDGTSFSLTKGSSLRDDR